MKKKTMIWIGVAVVAGYLIYQNNKKSKSMAGAPKPPETVSFAGNEQEFNRTYKN